MSESSNSMVDPWCRAKTVFQGLQQAMQVREVWELQSMKEVNLVLDGLISLSTLPFLLSSLQPSGSEESSKNMANLI